MRKIQKEILSTEYKQWLDELNRKNKPHPPRSEKYKTDVVMNLLYCQKGVCAYTEVSLCDARFWDKDKWKDGRYKSRKPGCSGELEHFDHDLKETEYWEWDNLFVAKSEINRLKGIKKVDKRFKPDAPDYDPRKYLEYKNNIFAAKSTISDTGLKESVEAMIKTLQLNFDDVRCKREKYLEMVAQYREFEQPLEIDQFFTACRMTGLSDGDE